MRWSPVVRASACAMPGRRRIPSRATPIAARLDDATGPIRAGLAVAGEPGASAKISSSIPRFQPTMCWLSVRIPIAPQQTANTGDNHRTARRLETYARRDRPQATSPSAALGFIVMAPPAPFRTSMSSAQPVRASAPTAAAKVPAAADARGNPAAPNLEELPERRGTVTPQREARVTPSDSARDICREGWSS